MADDEVIWAHSGTGDEFQCVHVDAWREAKARIAVLEAALAKEWEVNHSEHCRNQWPHDGVCHWPMPDCLQKSN